MSYAPTDEYEPPRLTQAVLWLIALNVAIYFLQITVQADLPRWLGFSRGEFGAHPWTVATYMFVHAGFWHLALNMYMLWAFGPRLERSWTTGAFTRFYLWCGAGGVVGQLLMPGDALLVGASAAVFGVLYGYARRWPDDEVLFFGVVPMKVRWLVLFMAVTNFALGALAAGEGTRGGTAYLAHLGGLAFGWLWFRRPNAPAVERLRARVATTPEPPEGLPRAVPKSLPRPPREQRGSEADEVVERSKALTAKQPQPARPALPVPPPPPRPVAPAAAVAAPTSRTAALDLVLEKISARGIGSLTVEERRLLDETSERLRTKD